MHSAIVHTTKQSQPPPVAYGDFSRNHRLIPPPSTPLTPSPLASVYQRPCRVYIHGHVFPSHLRDKPFHFKLHWFSSQFINETIWANICVVETGDGDGGTGRGRLFCTNERSSTHNMTRQIWGHTEKNPLIIPPQMYKAGHTRKRIATTRWYFC